MMSIYIIHKIRLTVLHKNTCIMCVLDNLAFIIPVARAKMSLFSVLVPYDFYIRGLSQ